MRHTQDTYVHTDGTKFRVMGNNILVRMDPLPTHTVSGLIEMPGAAIEHIVHTGTILAFGCLRTDDYDIPMPGIEVGLRCAFLRFHKEQHSNLQLRKIIDENIIKVGWTDLYIVWPAGETHVVTG